MCWSLQLRFLDRAMEACCTRPFHSIPFQGLKASCSSPSLLARILDRQTKPEKAKMLAARLLLAQSTRALPSRENLP